MPVHEIQVREYECTWCGYKWISRINGKDRPIPARCAKCKRRAWENGYEGYITPEEEGLRRRIKNLEKLYRYESRDWPNGLCEQFLRIKPRPTVRELKQVLYPLGYDTRKRRNWVPDPNRLGYLKYDDSMFIPNPDKPSETEYNPENNYQKILNEEKEKRIEAMVNIMKSRGVSYDLIPIPERQKEERLRREQSLIQSTEKQVDTKE
jgi:hypothetical protein